MLSPEIMKTGLWMSKPEGPQTALDIVLTDLVVGLDQAGLGFRAGNPWFADSSAILASFPD